MKLAEMDQDGVLMPYLAKGKVEIIEHCLDSMRGTSNYKWLKGKVEQARGAKVRVIRDNVRITAC